MKTFVALVVILAMCSLTVSVGLGCGGISIKDVVGNYESDAGPVALELRQDGTYVLNYTSPEGEPKTIEETYKIEGDYVVLASEEPSIEYVIKLEIEGEDLAPEGGGSKWIRQK